MMYPDISTMNGRERGREMLAAADRRRLARQARDIARAARRVRRLADHGSGVPGPQRLNKILLRGTR
jgi:hypothetical protein